MYVPALIKNTRIYVCKSIDPDKYELEPCYRWVYRVDNELYNYIYDPETHRVCILDLHNGVLEEDILAEYVPEQPASPK